MTHKSNSRISVTREQLDGAGKAAGLLPGQTDILWNQLSSLAPVATRFGAAQVAWYFGAAVILVAMTWLIAIVGDAYGTSALLATSLAYTGIFAIAGSRLAGQDGTRIPGGLLYVLAASMTPVTVSAAHDAFNLGFTGDQMTLLAAGATTVVGLALTRFTKIAFVSLPALIGGWMAAVAGADLVFGWGSWNWEVVSMVYGALLVAGSFAIDRGDDGEDYAFWGYAVGAVAAYAGLTFIAKGEFAYALYAAGGVASMLFSVIVGRKIFAFAGAAAVLTYLGHLSFVFFANSALFPAVLAALGIATIYGGVVYHRNSARIEAALLNLVPAGLRRR
jgi:hypothetical protein